MSSTSAAHPATADIVDVVLVGGGIMSATLGAMITKLQPDWSIELYERLGGLGEESSSPWNNAGTGHSGLCELNYMPDTDDATKANQIARQFQLSRQFWSALVASGDLAQPHMFVHATPHMDIVFGDDVDYLRRRFETLRTMPLFSGMEYSEDHAVITQWAPLLMEGRGAAERVAATRHADGTDVDFGNLTKNLIGIVTDAGGHVHVGHEVRTLRRGPDGLWTISGRRRHSRRRFSVRARFVFVGAGGYALKLLQRAKIPEVDGYAVLPAGADFLRTDNPEVVRRHDAKVYSQAAIGAPPMSVPHLDKRIVGGASSLLFGPYATFSTKLLKNGRLIDLFTTLRRRNAWVLLAALRRNVPLITYLVGELLASRRRKFAQLQRFYPSACPDDWYLVHAGLRAQLVKPDSDCVGVLTFGTELVTGADGTIAGLLGASPGASTAPAIMADLLAKCFPGRFDAWTPDLSVLMPGLQTPVDSDQRTADDNLRNTARTLGVA